MTDLAIRAGRAITPDGEVARTVLVTRGRIEALLAFDARVDADDQVELGPDEVLLPGIVDSHVHICEPGNTSWEGFATATRSAAAGGITTLVDMPLDSEPVTTDIPALNAKRAAADGQCHVDVGFWGGAVPGNVGDLAGLIDAGMLGVKCFMIDPGLDAFPPLDAGQIQQALETLLPTAAPLLIHAESGTAAATIPAAAGRNYGAYLRSRPRGVENLAVAQVVEAVRATGGRAHIVHLSSSDALPMLASARREGLRVTAETCPHYLSFNAEDIADGATPFKCSPPIREAANRDALWSALGGGLLDSVVSDHSPSLPDMKALDSGDFGPAWGGISSLQVSLPATWTEARRRGYSLVDLTRWMAEGPARLAGLSQKGRIEPGCDADFAVFAPDAEFTVSGDHLFHRHPVTPYDGRRLAGVVRATFLRGQRVDGALPRGRLLARQAN